MRMRSTPSGERASNDEAREKIGYCVGHVDPLVAHSPKIARESNRHIQRSGVPITQQSAPKVILHWSTFVALTRLMGWLRAQRDTSPGKCASSVTLRCPPWAPVSSSVSRRRLASKAGKPHQGAGVLTIDGIEWHYPSRRYDVIVRCVSAQEQGTFARIATVHTQVGRTWELLASPNREWLRS
jgi:hypothetical protein